MVTKNKIIKLLSYNNVEIIGSYGDEKVKYYSDIDLEEFINTKASKKYLKNFFKNIFIQSKENQDIYITDFKCGEYKNEPIRWKYEDIMKGYKMINNKKITFIQSLKMKSTIKLDIIAKIDNIFIEFSNNYYLYYKKDKKATYDLDYDEYQNRVSFISDYMDYRKENNVYKALKRMYSYYTLTNEKDKLNELQKLFNSDLGKIYKIKSNLQTLLLLLEQTFRKPNLDDVKYNIEIIKKDIPKNIKISNIENMNKKKLTKTIESLIKKLNEIINSESIKWINKNNFNITI
jgi:hypothetical protein